MRGFTGSVALADARIATHNGYFMRQTPFSLLALPSFLGAPENTEYTEKENPKFRVVRVFRGSKNAKF